MLHLSSSTSSKSSSTDKTKKKQVRFNERLHVVTVIECSEGNTSEDDQSKTRDDIAVLSRPTLSTMASSSLPFSSPRIRMTNQDNLPGWLHAGRKRMAEATTTTRSIHDIPPDLLSLPLPYQTTSLLSSVDCCRWYSNTSDQLSPIVPVRTKSCIDIITDAIEISAATVTATVTATSTATSTSISTVIEQD
jgi:hypothetical protein